MIRIAPIWLLNTNSAKQLSTKSKSRPRQSAESYSLNPEVALAIGRAELLLWRVDATDQIDWGGEPEARRWALSKLTNAQLDSAHEGSQASGHPNKD